MIGSFLSGLLSGSIHSGTPLLYATLGEVVEERAGIINLGLEGVMLMGAAVGFTTTVQTGKCRPGRSGRCSGRGLVQLDIRIPGDHPQGQPAGERAGADVLRSGSQCAARAPLTSAAGSRA